MNNKVLLMILDGWGNGRHDKADVISTVHPEYISAMTEKYPHAELRTDGENVGLPDGQMGNSEVGHLNIGAGRVVYQDLVKINRACRDNSIMQNPEVKAAFEYAKKNGVNVHFMGLVSDGGVHSSLEHLFKLCDIAAEYKIENTFVHCFMDGRDTDPRSGKGFVADLEKHMAASTGKVATVIGRYYAMDRDKRWERVKIAYDALVDGVGEKASDMVEAVQKSYDEGVTDEFIKPVVRVDAAGQPVGMIRPNDLVIFFNYRNDRAKELTIVLTQEDMPAEGMHTMPLYYCCMTPYDAKFTGLHILFDKENVPDTIGEWVSKQGLKQLRIAETEKYAHVTFFLNGGREEKFDGEERILVASPKVATYDLQPEMSAPEVAEKLVAALGEKKFDFICLNFANGDMVGHTGVYEAIVKAVKAVDKCVSEVVEAARANGYEVVMIADHGNADNAVNADGTPNTAHSLNPVPIVVVSDRVKSVRSDQFFSHFRGRHFGLEVIGRHLGRGDEDTLLTVEFLLAAAVGVERVGGAVAQVDVEEQVDVVLRVVDQPEGRDRAGPQSQPAFHALGRGERQFALAQAGFEVADGQRPLRIETHEVVAVALVVAEEEVLAVFRTVVAPPLAGDFDGRGLGVFIPFVADAAGVEKVENRLFAVHDSGVKTSAQAQRRPAQRDSEIEERATLPSLQNAVEQRAFQQRMPAGRVGLCAEQLRAGGNGSEDAPAVAETDVVCGP